MAGTASFATLKLIGRTATAQPSRFLVVVLGYLCWTAVAVVPLVLIATGSSLLAMLATAVAGIGVFGVGAHLRLDKARRQSFDLAEAAGGEVLTTRLRLRAPRRSDIDRIEQRLVPVLVRDHGWTEQLVQLWCEVVGGLADIVPTGEVLLFDRQTDELLGSVTLRPHPRGDGYMLGLNLADGSSGHGYMTEALQALLPLYNRAGFTPIWVGTAETNHRVQRLMGKLGIELAWAGPHELPNGTTVASRWYRSPPVPRPTSTTSETA